MNNLRVCVKNEDKGSLRAPNHDLMVGHVNVPSLAARPVQLAQAVVRPWRGGRARVEHRPDDDARPVSHHPRQRRPLLRTVSRAGFYPVLITGSRKNDIFLHAHSFGP